MKRLVFASTVAALIGALGGGALAARNAGAFDDVPPGMSLGGRTLARGASLGSAVDLRRAALEAREITIAVDATYLRVPLGELGIQLDVAACMRKVQERTGGSIGARIDRFFAARDGAIDAPLVFRFDEAKARSFLLALAPQVFRPPVNARLDLVEHVRIADVPGAELDVDATIEKLRSMPHEEGEVLSVALKPVRAAVTSDDLAAVDPAKVLASQETTFVLWGTGAGRAVNIANAARKLDGFVLGPGETFSFNDVVGARTLDNGFTYAPEIVGDELEIGVGGGTCQVASTLHAAALFGALEVLERHNHGRPSAYTKMGLDATVAYGKVDLKIRNPLPVPVLLHAYLPKPTAIRVEILGTEPFAKIDYRYGINKSDDFFRRITLKSFLPPGKVVLHQKGIRGFAVVSQVTTTYPDGRIVERSYLSDYRPVPEVFWVGPEFDETALPELPPGAARVERRGVPAPPTSSTGDAPPNTG
jgi:hypothetical protein